MFNWMGRSQNIEPLVLDEAYLERLNKHLGEDTLGELRSDGLLELMDRIETISVLSDRNDLEGLGRVMHDIAGMSGHLGLSRLSAAAVQAERALRDPSHSVDSATAMLRTEVPDAIAALRYFLDGAEAG